MGRYFRPERLEEALDAMGEGGWTPLAGGTDFYPARVGRPIDDDVLDLSQVAGLRGIAENEAGWRIGAATTWTDLVLAELPPPFDGLRAAAREVGGWQVQNAGTIAGNLCNASPAADGAPALLSLDARIELASRAGRRTLALEEFLLGARKTARRPDELAVAIHVPRHAPEARGAFLKLGARRYLVISIVMVAGVVALEGGRIAEVRLAVGACSDRALRLRALEDELTGRRPGEVALRPEHLAGLSPIDDCRADAGYRRDAALTLTRRLLAELGAA